MLAKWGSIAIWTLRNKMAIVKIKIGARFKIFNCTQSLARGLCYLLSGDSRGKKAKRNERRRVAK